MIGTGAIVGSYEILERLGTGGMGEVYRARHLHLDRQAAIKMLLMELSQDREAVDRFFAEARATSLIHHPGIVEVLDCNVHESGRVYLVMELLEGETLADRMRRDPELGRDLPLVLGIADQIEICDGVTILAMTAVSGSIRKPGVYSGAIGMDEVSSFRRSAARFRQLDEMARSLREIRKVVRPERPTRGDVR
jgi:hypothetical protein